MRFVYGLFGTLTGIGAGIVLSIAISAIAERSLAGSRAGRVVLWIMIGSAMVLCPIAGRVVGHRAAPRQSADAGRTFSYGVRGMLCGFLIGLVLAVALEFVIFAQRPNLKGGASYGGEARMLAVIIGCAAVGLFAGVTGANSPPGGTVSDPSRVAPGPKDAGRIRDSKPLNLPPFNGADTLPNIGAAPEGAPVRQAGDQDVAAINALRSVFVGCGALLVLGILCILAVRFL